MSDDTSTALLRKEGAEEEEEDLIARAAGEEDEIVIHAGMTPWQKATAFFGPGLLIATVYIDPGQIVVDMETGSAFQYRMLWAMLAANAMGLMFQHLCSRLAIVTGRNLAVECRLEYPRGMRIFLWLTVELASIAADLGYVMGKGGRTTQRPSHFNHPVTRYYYVFFFFARNKHCAFV